MDNTKIQWTDATWNPTRGCSRVSAGCDNCYAMREAHRHDYPGGAYEGLTRVGARGIDWAGFARFVPSTLDQPLRWKRPRRIFVNSMSDVFHRSLKNEEIAAIFGVMAAAPQHTFQVLTKQPQRAAEWFAWTRELSSGSAVRSADAITRACGSLAHLYAPSDATAQAQRTCHAVRIDWPLPNVQLGVSTENQETANERIPLLLQLPAAVRFISAEPLLGPLALREEWLRGRFEECPDETSDEATDPCRGCPGYTDKGGDYCGAIRGPRIDWVIVGGESGHGARHCGLPWLRNIVAQCRAAGVPVFVKQLGALASDWTPGRPEDQELVQLRHRKGGDPEEWPAELRVREFPAVPHV